MVLIMHPYHKAIDLISKYPYFVDAFALFLLIAFIGAIFEKIGKANQERKRIEGREDKEEL